MQDRHPDADNACGDQWPLREELLDPLLQLARLICHDSPDVLAGGFFDQIRLGKELRELRRSEVAHGNRWKLGELASQASHLPDGVVAKHSSAIARLRHG